ncbi:hypothetical protein [uncultured Amnibacterium sp.]|uniref:hypothetical protein n=1 Tax=uncultured Amnibacterium sp. TaxID=1631851 RepID=UPI0035CA6672
MRLELVSVALGPAATPTLPPVSGVLTDEGPAVVAVGGERGPLFASLIAGGRLAPERGSVLLDGSDDAAVLRRAVALVDTPMVAEPAAALPVATVVREELVFAERHGGRADAERVLAELGLRRWLHRPIADLPAADRLRLLLTLAARRPGVRALVLTSPERHGGPTADWLALAAEFTAAGTPVLVIAGHAVEAATRFALPVLTGRPGPTS